ncbi:MAG: FAD-binding protein, partial [Bacteroidaceae bacterium]|nr:FAD-binding protein [Bacteroidaceae bacterium]
GGQWSNSGMVVEIRPEDLEGEGALKVLAFQEQLERDCWQQGNRKQTAPAQRMADFVNTRLSFDLPRTSYAPGLISSPLHFWLPQSVSHRLQEGFKTFGRQSHGFLTNEAVMIGVETRTSSPVRIVRDSETLMHVRLAGLFPCGEGAGYAGGIVSAGVDGERCADMCAEYLHAEK